MGSILPPGARNETAVYYLKSTFLKSADLKNLKNDEQILGGFLFTDCAFPDDAPCLRAGFTPFPDQPEMEVWLSPKPVRYEQVGPLKLAYDGETLFGALSIPNTNDALDERTREAYQSIFQNSERLGYPNLFRMWNYLPGINESDDHGLERYQSFCRGRARAFFRDRTFQETFLPAGTGVGSRSGGLNIAFMASQEKIQVNLENPVQMPAYHYPRQYGPRSPSFARGTWVSRGPKAGEFYVSGTASIIGHETLHQDDITRQCETTLQNIERLISAENLSRYKLNRDFNLKMLDNLRIYIRRPEDFDAVKRICQAHFSPKASTAYLGADICRSDLLVEIEGWINWLPEESEDTPCY